MEGTTGKKKKKKKKEEKLFTVPQFLCLKLLYLPLCTYIEIVCLVVTPFININNRSNSITSGQKDSVRVTVSSCLIQCSCLFLVFVFIPKTNCSLFFVFNM